MQKDHNIMSRYCIFLLEAHMSVRTRAVVPAEWEPGLMEANELGIPVQKQTD